MPTGTSARSPGRSAPPTEAVRSQFLLLSSGSLSCTQSIITLIQRDFDQGKGLAQAPSLYDAARIIGEQVRRVSDMDRDALERDDFKFNVNLVLGGQVRGESPGRGSSMGLGRSGARPAPATDDDAITEVILATAPSVEGEATAMYLARLIKPLGDRPLVVLSSGKRLAA